jgi:hypothetical protein
MWNLISVSSEIVLASAQDRSTVCAKCTIGSEIVFNRPMVFLGDKAQVEGGFGPFGDSAKLDARYVHGLCQDTTGSETILDTLDRTPR